MAVIRSRMPFTSSSFPSTRNWNVEAVDQGGSSRAPFECPKGQALLNRLHRSRHVRAGDLAVNPSRMKNRPLPPLSTLPACASTGRRLGVLATARIRRQHGLVQHVSQVLVQLSCACCRCRLRPPSGWCLPRAG